MTGHIPVLANEVLSALDLQPGMTVVDGTLGLGGHAALMLERTAPDGRFIGIDRDDRNLALAKERLRPFGARVNLFHDSYANMATHAPRAQAILLDLGFSSLHVDDPNRGFSFMHDGPLDMRYDTSQGSTAADLVNGAPREELAAIFRRYGEEMRAERIAKAIIDRRREEKFTRTLEFAEFIAALVPRTGKMHPATKVFQALRIAVNDELGELERGLDAAISTLDVGGKIAIITFHSLEDRMVKQFFKNDARVTALTKRPVKPGEEEIRQNPRSRSAKLRVAQKN